MINRSRAKPKRKPRGDPFKKGDDDRRGKNGPLSNAAAIYEMRYRNDVAKRMAPESLSKIIVDAAKKGRIWAIKMLHDDMVGLPIQPIGGEGGGPIILRAIWGNGDNGNGKE